MGSTPLYDALRAFAAQRPLRMHMPGHKGKSLPAPELAAIARRAAEKLGWPIFVKPANAGSSVGISKAADRAALEKGLQASGLPLSAYLRKLILGESIQAAPSEELRRLRTEIHQIGNNINQLARKANAGFASRDEVTRALRMLDRVYELMYQLSQQSWQ